MQSLPSRTSLLPPDAELAKPPDPPSPVRIAPINPLIIGARLRTARIRAHQTQQELAGDTLSKGYVSGVERGKLTPSFQVLRTLAQRLGVTVSSLLGETDSDSSTLGGPQEALQATPEPAEAPAAQTQEELRSQVEDLLHLGHYDPRIAQRGY